jgi:hypothetical protein
VRIEAVVFLTRGNEYFLWQLLWDLKRDSGCCYGTTDTLWQNTDTFWSLTDIFPSLCKERKWGHEIALLSVCQYYFIIIFIIVSGVRLSPLGTAATTGLLYQPQMIDEGDCGEIDGMKIGRGNRSTRRKSAPAPFCPQIPHDQTRARTRAAAVGSQRLTAWLWRGLPVCQYLSLPIIWPMSAYEFHAEEVTLTSYFLWVAVRGRST